MQLVKIAQNTPEWLHFRRTHIGASDAISIMGLSPWKSILDLYEEKVFQFEQDDNHYMSRGKALEPIALEAFENETGLTMFPMVFKHDTISWMSASFDGVSLDRKVILEIKCPGKKDHHFVDVNKMVPVKYRSQIQHQIEVSGLDFAYYYSFDGEKGVIIEVKRDQEFIEKMLEKELEFWHCLQTFTPPKLISKRNKDGLDRC